jgi:hypothetical protein
VQIDVRVKFHKTGSGVQQMIKVLIAVKELDIIFEFHKGGSFKTSPRAELNSWSRGNNSE